MANNTPADPRVRKEAILDYSERQIKFLAYLHKEVIKTFVEQDIVLSEETVEKYAVTVYLSTKKEFS